MFLKLCHWDWVCPFVPKKTQPHLLWTRHSGMPQGIKHSLHLHEHTKMITSKIGEYSEESWVEVFLLRGWWRPREVLTFKPRLEGG